MRFGTYIYGRQKMNPTDFDDILIFSLMPPTGQQVHLMTEQLQN